ncbi:hypothetical protein ACOMHN_009682 [Nucella lapillus]
MVFTRRAARVANISSVTTRGGGFNSLRGNSFQKRTTPSTMTRRTKAARKMKYSPPPSSASSGRSGTRSPVQGDGKDGPASPPRRPIRPVDRQKMLDWLLDKLSRKEMPKKLRWEVEGKIFLVRWPHAARQGFSKDDDAELYRAYAEHTGLHRAGEQGDHKRWKANFRCALRSVPNVREIRTKDGRKGPQAARRYEILDTPEVRNRKTSKNHCRPEPSPEHKGENSDGWVSVETQDNLPLPVSTMLKVPVVTTVGGEEACQKNIPNFKHLGLTTCIQHNLLSGGSVKVLSPDDASSPSPLPTQSFTATTTSFPFTSGTPAPTLTLTPSSSFPAPFPTLSSSLSQSFPVTISTPTPSFPTPTTTTTTTLIPTPTPRFSVPIPNLGELPEDLARDMVPVAVMFRERTPSGDSGLPGSPPVWSLPREVGQEEELGGTEPLLLNAVDMEISADEGIEIMCDIGANEYIDVSEVQFFDAVSQNGSMERVTDVFLDISNNKPGITDSAVAVKTGTHDDFTYTCLSLPASTMETE